MTDVVKPSPEELAAQRAFNVEAEIKSTLRSIRVAWIDLARGLYVFNTESLWRDLGYDNFEEWLAGPDISLGRSWVYELITIWREYVVLRDVRPADLIGIDASKLGRILPALRKNQIDVQTALSDAGSLSKMDLADRYSAGGAGTVQTANGSAPDLSTRYDAGSEPQFIRCPTCGSRVREEDIRAAS